MQQELANAYKVLEDFFKEKDVKSFEDIESALTREVIDLYME